MEKPKGRWFNQKILEFRCFGDGKGHLVKEHYAVYPERQIVVAKNKVERLSLGDSPGSPSSIPEDIKGRVVKPSDVEAIIYEDPVRLEGCVIYDTASWACKNNEGSTVVVNDGKKYVSHSSSAEE